MNAFLKSSWGWCAAIIAAGIIGFFAGRAHTDTVPKIEYVKGKEVHDSIPVEKLVPYDSIVYRLRDVKQHLPSVPDTVWFDGEIKYVTEKVDTAAIVSDFVVNRKYSNTLFDNDTTGRLVVNSDVQYNRLLKLGYTYTPVQKIVTKERKRTVTPFITGSYNTFNQAGAGVGIYIHSIGVSAKYMKDLGTGKTGYEGSINIKF